MLFFCCIFCMIVSKGGTSTCIYAESGATAKLRCPITKNSDKMQWSYMNNSSKMIIADKDQINHKLEEKSKFIVDVNILNELYALSITNLSESDEKTYTCWTQNVSFNTTNITSFRLYLKKRPSHLLLAEPVWNNTIEWIENQDLTISCSVVGGVPSSKVSWIYQPDISVTNNGDSVWSNISFTPTRHYNGRVYMCIAEHALLPIALNETVVINVLYKPVIRISRWPIGDIFVDEIVILSCVSNSNPITTNITWIRDDVFLTGNFNHTIYNATINDSGLFVCKVTNDIGMTVDNISIDIKDSGSFIQTTPKILVDIEISDLPSILIYLIACCCAVGVFTTTAKLYTCWKLGKLQCIIQRRQNLNSVHLNQQNTFQEANTDHYTEIEL